MQLSVVRCLLQALIITAAALSPGLALSNPIDDSTFFVTQLHRDLLNRNPTPSELSFWVGNLDSCSNDTWCSLSERRVFVAQKIFDSPEHYVAQNMSPYSYWFNWQYVDRCYTQLLRREPDSDGFMFWYDHLASTGDYTGVIRGFITSPEYRLRFGSN